MVWRVKALRPYLERFETRDGSSGPLVTALKLGIFSMNWSLGAGNTAIRVWSNIPKRYQKLDGRRFIPFLTPRNCQLNPPVNEAPICPITSYKTGDLWGENLIKSTAINTNWIRNFMFKTESSLKARPKIYPTDKSTKWTMCIPHSRRQQVLSERHDQPTAGHLGIRKQWSEFAINISGLAGKKRL